MLTDYFLKFTSKQQALEVFSAIPEHTYINSESNTIEVTSQTETFAIDEVGILYHNDGVYSEDGTVITPPTQIDGYHYNYRIVYGNKPEISLPVELVSYLVYPENPQRSFF